jgi:squalene-hopene/tetraprenyl-beta-curcumene cyclase
MTAPRTRADSAASLAATGIRELLAEARQGFREAAHVMSFPVEQGFSNPADQHTGDVFQRALLLDVLCQARPHFAIPQELIDRESAYLLDRRRRTGIGGWAYFPELPELPPDADDLAQVMLAFLRAGRRDLVERWCEEPLAALLADASSGDGVFETWIIPRTRNAEQQLQLGWAQMAWGTGADSEVMANLLYALHCYDAARFGLRIRAGASYLLSRQDAEGWWRSTWYHGPYYGTWACLRILDLFETAAPAAARARAFLRAAQQADGGWGRPGHSDPLNTALALLALDRAAPDAACRKRGFEFLSACYEPGCAWPPPDFIRMDLGRPTGRPWNTLTYGSRTITTAFVTKAALERAES